MSPLLEKSPRRVRRRALALALCAAVAASVAGVALASGAGYTDVTARYPASAAQDVPATARISAQLRTGWFRRSIPDIRVARSDGSIVEGRSDWNGDDVLVFAPDQPLRPGRYDVRVQDLASDAPHAAVESWSFTVGDEPALSGGPGGSILLVAREGTRDAYLAEILRTEGFTGFDTVTPEEISSRELAQHAVVILGAAAATGSPSPDLESWVKGGGELIVMKPEGRLARLAGLEPTGRTLADGYVTIDTARPPGAGLTSEPMQFHGVASLYEGGPGTVTAADLSPSRGGLAAAPAVTVADVGSGGHIASFSYDLATSVLYTRQADPATAGEERDGTPPIRANDMFVAPDGDHQQLDISRIGIPQADEQMRLLSNVLEQLHADSFPLPRFWYLPGGEKAGIVMAGDDHATREGTRRLFDRMLQLSRPGCDAERWECLRATSWLFPGSGLGAADAERYAGLGFDLGAHVNTDCKDWTEQSLDADFARSMLEFRAAYPGLDTQRGHRLHCIAYSDWLGLPTEEARWGIELDMNFYNWPPDWIRGRPGYMTGSALPMRFSDDDGRTLDVFQQESHLVNETWRENMAAVEELITAARDGRGFYGVFGTHYDYTDDFEQRLIDIAVRRHVPLVSAAQLLDFTRGRQASAFTDVKPTEAGGLTFGMSVDPLVRGSLRGMLPVAWGQRVLSGLSADGEPVHYDVERIKGIEYAFFAAEDRRYEAQYR